MASSEQIYDLQSRLGVSESVAHELLLLSGDDVDLAEQASKASKGLNQAKCLIINQRFRMLEEDVDMLFQE